MPRFPTPHCLLYFSCFHKNVIERKADNGIYRSKAFESLNSTVQLLMFLKHSMKWKGFLRGTLCNCSWLNSLLIFHFPRLEHRFLTICSATYALKCLIILSTSICVQICSYMHVKCANIFIMLKEGKVCKVKLKGGKNTQSIKVAWCYDSNRYI